MTRHCVNIAIMGFKKGMEPFGEQIGHNLKGREDHGTATIIPTGEQPQKRASDSLLDSVAPKQFLKFNTVMITKPLLR